MFGVLPKMSKKERFVGAAGMPTASALRRKVMVALGRITGDSPVHIPAGKQAAQLAYAYAASTGRKCSVRNGRVTFSE